MFGANFVENVFSSLDNKAKHMQKSVFSYVFVKQAKLLRSYL